MMAIISLGFLRCCVTFLAVQRKREIRLMERLLRNHE